ncbi:MAG: ATP-dependent helicase HrpB [Campylobacteraceae bacterium]|nr:ATP-dependent helicase HrpB [Campylobacteraceae bacterium]
MYTEYMNKLPINNVLEEIKYALKNESKLILQAAPGAGKSTVVPLSLMREEYIQDKMILVLQPRRVAARTLAIQMSKLLNENLGHSVGYKVKNDSVYGSETKVLIVTEGILTKMLQNDQSLEQIALVIFDEFHERSIHSDLSLALCLEVQELLRDDLKILLMSATINEEEIKKILPLTPIIRCENRQYTLENIYLDKNIKVNDQKSLQIALENRCIEVIKNEKGNILVFLAGVKEIHVLKDYLDQRVSNEIEVLLLYSALSQDLQDKAIYASNKRKIILSTNIAQTSLTIAGISTVIDTGLEKVSLYNHSNAMNSLNMSFISQESAIQRAGRAARLGNGKCYKLWHKSKILEISSKAEVLRADITSFVLELSLWGAKDLNELNFIDIPDKKSLESTYTLLKNLEMIDKDLNITSFGKDALSLGLHPRLAYMILKSYTLGYAKIACILAALLESKDIYNKGSYDSDLENRFLSIYNNEDNAYLNRHAVKEVKKEAKSFLSKLKRTKKAYKELEHVIEEDFDTKILGVLLLFAYPDRLAKIRSLNDNKYLLSNKKGAYLHTSDYLFNEEYLVVANVQSKDKDSFIRLALKVELEDIEKYFKDKITEEESIVYNKEKESLEFKSHTKFLDLELYVKAEKQSKNFKELLIKLTREQGLDFLNWNKKALNLRERLNFLNESVSKGLYSSDSRINKINDAYLLNNLDTFLAPYLDKVKSVKDLKNLDMFNILSSYLSYNETQELNELLAQTFKTPAGTNIFIDYSSKDKAILKVKIQEVFGLKESPNILNNSIPLQVHLLSPALRVIQITNDLKSFWKNSYAEVRKELRGKYKRHYWPEDPNTAIATNKTKKNMMR